MWDERYIVGQLIGVVSGVGVFALWMAAIWFPSAELTLSGASFIVALVMAIVAIFAIIASLRKHGTVLMVLFMASFFPVGLYLFGVPHWVRWIGAFNLGYLIAGFVIWRTRRSLSES